MLRQTFLIILLITALSTSTIAQTTIDSVIQNGSIDQVVDVLEQNHPQYDDTEDLKRQVEGFHEQRKMYVSKIATKFYNSISKFDQNYVSEYAHTLLNRSQSYYEEGLNLKSAQYYIVASFVRRKDYIVMENNLKETINRAKTFYNQKNYTTAQHEIDRAEKLIVNNPVLDNNVRLKDSYTDLQKLRKKNHWKLTQGDAMSFITMSDKIILRVDFVNGFPSNIINHLAAKNQARLQSRTNSGYVTYKKSEAGSEYGLGLNLLYHIQSSLWLTVDTRLFPFLETNVLMNSTETGGISNSYKNNTLLIDINLGLTDYIYESHNLRLYFNLGAGLAQGLIRDQKTNLNRIERPGSYDKLFQMVTGAVGVDFLPFAEHSYMNAEVQVGQYFGIHESMGISLFSVSLGTGWYF